VLTRELAPVVRCNGFAFGDANQRIMSIEIVSAWEIGFVRSNDWQTERIGKRKEFRLDPHLGCQPVTLQLDIDALRCRGRQCLQPVPCKWFITIRNRAVNRPVRPTGQD